jgi:general secretion pathway protein A
MYEAFYGLREKPFNLTPDPKYLYLSEKHKEAFAHLLYGVKHRSGFVMVTGEIGTGKTTICRNLLNQLDADVEIAFIFNPYLNPVELLKKINQEFGIDFSPNTALELSELLNTYLLEAASQGKNCILLIDEAQNLESKVLEQIRLLSNLETETQKLLQIILIGQPELTEKLALYELRQLNQRITARYHLKPLDEKETLQYIAYRVHVAGGRKKVHFTRSAVRTVYRRSGGVPRLINAISDRALLIGYTREMRTITPSVIRKAANEIRGEQTGKSQWLSMVRGWLPSPALIAAVLLVAVLIRFVAPPLERLAREFGTFNALLSGAPTAPNGDAAGNAVDARPVDPDAPAGAQTAANSLANRVAERIVANAPAVEDPALAMKSLLETADPLPTGQAALAALATVWGRSLPAPNGTPTGDLAAQARELDLAVEKLKPALYQLLALNLPALVQVRHGEKALWLALVKQEDETLFLDGGPSHQLALPRAAFQEFYAGEAIVLWPDPNPKAPALFPGRSDQQVAALKDALRRVGRIDGAATSNTYDTETASAVSRVQAETGLSVDGIAGRQVRMVLASWTGDDNIPALRPRVPLAPAAAPVVEARRAPESKPRPAAAPTPMPALNVPEPPPAPPQLEVPVTNSGEAEESAAPAPATPATPDTTADATGFPFMNLPSLEVVDLPAPGAAEVMPPLAAAEAPQTPSTPILQE